MPSARFSSCFRDLIKVLKWYVDRITEAERQEHIQEVLKVMARLRTANRGSRSWREMIAA